MFVLFFFWGGVRARVTELKYVVLSPVYQIIRPPGSNNACASLASSKQQASSTGPFLVRRAEGVPKSKKKKLPHYPGWFSATVLGTTFFGGSDPHVVGNVDLLGFWPILGRGH